MKICHIITRLINGGADENTVLTCNYQAHHGNEVTLIYGDESHEEIIAKVDDRVSLIRIPELIRSINPLCDIKAFRQIRKTIRNLSPDVVHTHTSKAGIIGRLAAKRSQAQIIVHGIHILPFSNVGILQKAIYVILEKLVAQKTDLFVSVSKALMEENVAHGIAPLEKHIVVPSGMDVSIFQNATPLQAEESMPPQFCGAAKKYVVYVGALEARKRQLETLDVFKKVVEDYPDAVLLLVGGGHDQQLITDKISELKLENNVHPMGFRADVERIIKLSDVCILSSKREGLARVLIQYCLAGKPIVSTRLPGTEIIVDEGKNGFLVDTDNLEEMGSRLLELLNDRDLVDRFSRHSSKKDLSKWSDQAMGESIEQAYAKLMKQKAS
ncbi:MAG: glycosyltransferase family 4 protein [Opitutaceae bacterium]